MWIAIATAIFFAIVSPLNAQLGWSTYGGDPGGQRFSASKQFTRANVGQLQPVWTYHTHALDNPRMGSAMASFEATPVLLDKTLFLSTPFDEVIALDAETGAEKWKFDTKPVLAGEGNLTTSRGVAVWVGHERGPCARRVFIATLDGRLLVVDAENGNPCLGFGDHGQVDLKKDVGGQGLYEVTSAPTVLGDVVIVGSSIPDSMSAAELRGTVHAYDVRTGKLLWAWDPIGAWAQKQPEAVRTGAGNSWSTIAADPQLGMVFIPTGSASPDYYGVLRPGDNKDANSVVAIEAKTGKRVWGFQVVHHDLWDYDVAAEPLLFTWHGKTPAIAIGTKMGQIFVLDRRTGTPLFPIEERPVPKSDVPGEEASPTQPFSSLPTVGPIDLNQPAPQLHRSAEDQEDCVKAMAGKRYEGLYTPPSLKGSLQYPGSIGGINWGGMAFDPTSQTLYANDNNDIYEVDLIPRTEMEARLSAAPPAPTWQRPLHWFFLTRKRKYFLVFVAVLPVLLGCLLRRSLNPGVASIAIAALVMLVIPMHRFLLKRNAEHLVSVRVEHVNASRNDTYAPQLGTPYWMHVKPVSDRQERPCSSLPWGALTAIDLNAGKQAFRVEHGPDVDGQPTGSLSVSGPIATAGGLIFSAGTRASILYAYDSATGERVGQIQLPGPAQATPMSYEISGRQYLVIAAGGHGPLGLKQGDSVIAFALPKSN